MPKYDALLANAVALEYSEVLTLIETVMMSCDFESQPGAQTKNDFM